MKPEPLYRDWCPHCGAYTVQQSATLRNPPRQVQICLVRCHVAFDPRNAPLTR